MLNTSKQGSNSTCSQ